MSQKSGVYQDTYIKRDGELVSLKSDVTAFCEKFIKPAHPKNWDWSKRDFDNEKNLPTVAEARAIRAVSYTHLTLPTNREV